MNELHRTSIACVLLTLTCAAVLQAEQDSQQSPLVLAKMGVMYVGGRSIPMQGGGRFGGGGSQTQIVDQALVHYLIPPEARQHGKLPVIMVPGMGLTSYLYLSTPDGRDGWAQIFAKAGHPAYVFDEPGNAICGFDVSKFNAARTGEADAAGLPGFMLWSNETVWRRWGIGSEPGKPFPDTQYPVKHIDQLYRSMTPVYKSGQGGGGGRGGAAEGRKGAAESVPNRSRPQTGTTSSQSGPGGTAEPSAGRVGRGRGGRRRPAAGQEGGASSGGARAGGRGGRGRRAAGQQNGPGGGAGGRFGSGTKSDALIQLLEKTGPAILIVHSASGSTGFDAVRKQGKLVKAIVAVEVVGAPTDPADIKAHFADKRFIGVFGDHFDVRPMSGRHQACETTAKLIREAGGKAHVIWLPKLGIKGNTHLLMQDKNNDLIARKIMERLSN